MNKTKIIVGLLFLGSLVALSYTIESRKSNASPEIIEIDTKNYTSNSIKSQTPTKEKTKNNIKKISLVNVDLNRLVVIEGTVGVNAISGARQIEIMNQDSTTRPIVILLDSPGGSVIDGSMLLSAMEASKAPIYTVCHRMCASMAATIHAYGNKRMMIDRSVLMYHPATAGTQGSVEQMKSFSDFLNRYIGKIETYIINKSKLTHEEFQRLKQFDIWIDAEDATAWGLNDEIVSLNLKEELFTNKEVITEETLKTKLKEVVW